ncbi:MAG: hypothetical protein ACYC6N_28740 [Pirellulaceae bacterium]
MRPPSRVSRRRFLGVSTAAAGGLFMVRDAARGVDSVAPSSDFPSTEHFWYRSQPEGLFVDSQCENRAFGFSDGKLFLSEDNGRTWPHSTPFADARHIVFSCILRNGNVVFSALAKLYLSADNLKTYRQITVKNRDGTDYIPHSPQNPALPGWYFHSLTGVNTWEVNATEMLVWGNYCNVIGGAAPVNIYYSTDHGQTVKIAYSFGQSPYNRDDGSEGGGTTGTMLGNAENPVTCRHIHDVAYNPAEDAFYACTGDFDRAEGYECHWLKGTYDANTDKWDWKVIVSDAMNSRYKCGGINFVAGQLYWISDSNGPEPYDRGIFRCAPGDLANRAAHTRLFNPGIESGNMIIQDGVILASHCAPASTLATGFIVSPDMGKTWAQYDLQEFGRRSPCRFHRKNSDGWFRVDLRSSWVTPAEMMFIKPKTAQGGGPG